MPHLAHDDSSLPGEGGASGGLHLGLGDAGGSGDCDLAAGKNNNNNDGFLFSLVITSTLLI